MGHLKMIQFGRVRGLDGGILGSQTQWCYPQVSKSNHLRVTTIFAFLQGVPNLTKLNLKMDRFGRVKCQNRGFWGLRTQWCKSQVSKIKDKKVYTFQIKFF